MQEELQEHWELEAPLVPWVETFPLSILILQALGNTTEENLRFLPP